MRINTPSYSPLFLPANHHPWFCIGSGRPSPSLSISSLPPLGASRFCLCLVALPSALTLSPESPLTSVDCLSRPRCVSPSPPSPRPCCSPEPPPTPSSKRSAPVPTLSSTRATPRVASRSSRMVSIHPPSLPDRELTSDSPIVSTYITYPNPLSLRALARRNTAVVYLTDVFGIELLQNKRHVHPHPHHPLLPV